MNALDWSNYSNDPCYICGRKLGSKTPHVAYLEDDDHAPVFVGRECIKQVTLAGATGVRGRKTGPRVFATVELAERVQS